jgi:hypothetical protein
MSSKIKRPADIPTEAYHYWHRRWCEILSEDHREVIRGAGLAGKSFTERVPDTPDGKGYFSYSVDDDGRVAFLDGVGEAVAEYDSYELGFRMLSDASFDSQKQIEEGRFRIVSEPESWEALMGLMPILRGACQQAVDEAADKFDLELPKYW